MYILDNVFWKNVFFRGVFFKKPEKLDRDIEKYGLSEGNLKAIPKKIFRSQRFTKSC